MTPTYTPTTLHTLPMLPIYTVYDAYAACVHTAALHAEGPPPTGPLKVSIHNSP